MARDVFEANTFGAMVTMQAFIQQFRERRSGVIFNVTSSVTLAGVYAASKTAIPGLPGSLAFETAAFNVRVNLVEPGFGLTPASPREAQHVSTA